MWEKDDDVSRDALISLLLLLLLLLGIIFVSPLISMPLLLPFLPLPLFNAKVEDELLLFLPPPLISPVFFSRSTRRLRL